MTHKEVEAKISAYANGHQILLNALDRYPREMWHYKPDAADWSIQEIIVHITDSEVNSYVRCRRFLAEPGKPLMAYDENEWAKALDYQGQSATAALELFCWLRKNSYDLIKAAPAEVWQRECYHPENGTMTMADWLDTYERHVPEHVTQMNGVYERWLASENA